MTEHRKIPLPRDGGANAADGSSLLERASASFGLDGLGAAPMPRRLAEPPMKRARPVQREEAPAPEEKPGEPVQSEARPQGRASVHRVPQEYEAPAPAPVPAVASVPAALEAAETTRINLGGKAHPVDRAHLRDQALIVPEDPVSELLEEFRIVKRQLIAAARAAGSDSARRVLICSPHSGEGKTFCSANLAIALAAERGAEVLLVDADLAKPSLPRVFGLPGEGPGFMDALANPSLDLASLPLRTDIPGLWVLPAGSQHSDDTEYLASRRTREVLDAYTAGAPERILIFDTPPALAASPAAELAKHVGQAVLVARADHTGHSALEDAYGLLSGCPDIKLMLNAAQFSPSGRRFGTYYGREES